MRPCPPPESPKTFFWQDTLLKIGFQTYTFCSKVHLKCRKYRFRDPKFQNGISNPYILLKSALKMQEMPFQRPKFQKIYGGACPRTPQKLCRHYGLPLTKSLATPLFMRHARTFDAALGSSLYNQQERLGKNLMTQSSFRRLFISDPRASKDRNCLLPITSVNLIVFTGSSLGFLVYRMTRLLFHVSPWRRAYARNVRLYYRYRQYTNHFDLFQ